ncbi:MAG: hypothetical protein DRO11_04895 [Methanobacteriota archaeon]|nr:MAG: hypothetical protein DRO11_04895 [Euryarchaeota archaeon]
MAEKERNPVTLETFNRDQTWDMALDPEKWGIPISKEELQARIGRRERMLEPGEISNPKETLWSFFPDITNPTYQELLISWAKKQIDAGADAIWFDMLFGTVNVLRRLLEEQGYTEEEIFGHPAVKESYKATLKVIDAIHEYGYKKYGKRIYLGTWWVPAEMPYEPPDLDWVQISPTGKEILTLKLDEAEWDRKIELIRKKFGDDILIAVYISWAHTTMSPLGNFSQKLTPEKQREFIKLIDEFCQRKGMNYVYPLHGGFMGLDAEILSFGKFKIYDSLAPEFQTYETIKELAQKKAETKPAKKFYCPKENAEFLITVRNTGNGADFVVLHPWLGSEACGKIVWPMETSSLPAYPTPGGQPLDPPYGPITPKKPGQGWLSTGFVLTPSLYGEQTYTIKLKIPESASPGEYKLFARVKSAGHPSQAWQPGDPGSPPDYPYKVVDEKELSLEIGANLIPKLEVLHPLPEPGEPPTSIGYPETCEKPAKPAEFLLRISNKGNASSHFNLDYDPPRVGWKVEFYDLEGNKLVDHTEDGLPDIWLEAQDLEDCNHRVDRRDSVEIYVRVFPPKLSLPGAEFVTDIIVEPVITREALLCQLEGDSATIRTVVGELG